MEILLPSGQTTELYNIFTKIKPRQVDSWWVLELMNYDYEIEHKPGINNEAADALSRLPEFPKSTESQPEIPADPHITTVTVQDSENHEYYWIMMALCKIWLVTSFNFWWGWQWLWHSNDDGQFCRILFWYHENYYHRRAKILWGDWTMVPIHSNRKCPTWSWIQ